MNIFIMPPPVVKGTVSVAFFRPSVRPSRTQRPSVPNFGMKVLHPRCDSRTSFKVKRSTVRDTRRINADTHPAPSLPNANLPHTAGCCCMAYFSAISVSICTKLACSIPMRDHNTVTEPSFRKWLSKSRILSPKNSYLSISVV